MAGGGGAHAGKHGVDESRGGQQTRPGRAAASHRGDQRVPREARPQMKAPHVSLRSRLLYLAAAAFLPLALVSGISLLALVHQQREQAERAGIEITRALSTAVDAELSRSFAALDALATSTILDTGNLKSFQDRALRVIATRSQWRSVILHDRSGRMLLNTSYPIGAALPPTTEGQSVLYV